MPSMDFLQIRSKSTDHGVESVHKTWVAVLPIIEGKAYAVEGWGRSQGDNMCVRVPLVQAE